MPFLFAVLLVSATTAAAESPNILLICVDDLKPLLGCYGDNTIQSPNIDRLAKRSVLFERAYCNQAVCAPSRNALLTGLRPQTLGIYDLGTNFRRARPQTLTLPQSFKQNGYRSQGLGKIFHVGHGNHEDPDSWSVPHWKADVIAYALAESRSNHGLTREEALFANKSAKGLPRGAPYEAADVPDNTYPDGALADEAIQRLREIKKNPKTPFFLALGYVKPHLPFVAPLRYWNLYDPAKLPLPEVRSTPAGAPPYAANFGGELRQYRGIPESGPLDEQLHRKLIHGYHAAVSFVDAQIGRVLDELDRLELTDNTIVVLWGDHGWHLGDHGFWCKHTNYEQATRIPLLVAAPGIKPRVESDSMIETVDIYPTLCELAGTTHPEGLDGKSFASTLRDPATPARPFVFHVYPRTGPNRMQLLGRAVRTPRYRLVEWRAWGASQSDADLELYDYQTDPLETRNLAADQPDTVRQLLKQLHTQPEPTPPVKAKPTPRKPPKPNSPTS